MNDLTDENREPIRDLTTDVATLHLELHELRQSLAVLQATLPQRQEEFGSSAGERRRR